MNINWCYCWKHSLDNIGLTGYVFLIDRPRAIIRKDILSMTNYDDDDLVLRSKFLWTVATSFEIIWLWASMVMKLAKRRCETRITLRSQTSWNMMKFFISSLTRFWYWTWKKNNIIELGIYQIRFSICWPYLVPVCGNWNQCGSKADRNVVRVHHVLVAAIANQWSINSLRSPTLTRRGGWGRQRDSAWQQRCSWNER